MLDILNQASPTHQHLRTVMGVKLRNEAWKNKIKLIVVLSQEAKSKEKLSVDFYDWIFLSLFEPVGELYRTGSHSICAVNNSVISEKLVQCEQTGIPMR